MRKSILISVLIAILSLTLGAQERVVIGEWLLYGPRAMPLPAFADQKNAENRPFETAALLGELSWDAAALANVSMRTVKAGTDGLVVPGGKGHQLLLLQTFLSVGRWTKGALLLSLNGLGEVSLDGATVFTKKKDDEKEERIELILDGGKHRILVKSLFNDGDLRLKAAFLPDKEFADCGATASVDPSRTVTIHDVLEGRQIASAQISPSGKFLLLHIRDIAPGNGKDRGSRVIYDIDARRNLGPLRGDAGNIQWLPKTDRLSYTVPFGETEDLYVYDVLRGEEHRLAQGLKNLTLTVWSPGEDRLVFGRLNEAGKPGDLKRVYGVEDRIPGFRDRTSLHLFDVAGGRVTPLTAGPLSAEFHDFSPDGRHILFATTRLDYGTVPFTRQNLYEMDLDSLELEVVWQDKLYPGEAQYSPDGKSLLVRGGPECFGDLGVKVREGRIPNSYDTQIYILDLAGRKVRAVSRDFDPAVEGARWSADGRVYLQVTERDYTRLYRYSPADDRYESIPLPVEVLDRIDYDLAGRRAVFSGTGASSPERLYLLDLPGKTSRLIVFPKEEQFKDVRFGACRDWDFVNRKGDTISGRFYLPVGFQEGRTYPLIVNYYGGTTPVERSFGGRYPIEVWAAAGYLVYVLQPSGATGFGQDFSALHVNGWGFEAIDDIIEGTKAFLAAHPAADARNVGCIGASYGGYTTMLLQTRTDIFKTAVSHAGISDITSYWGEGYWGYSYNTGAAKNSYPWNRKDIFVDNSPLFNADKFRNSILLLHGSADTNVPVGESLQYYAALKLLGKDVEMVLVDGQNHHILDYGKRLKWHDTIMSWFDWKLKGQPQQWNALYPEKSY